MRNFLTIVFITSLVGFLGLLTLSKANATQTKGVNAECEVNNSDKSCDEGLICVPFNEESNNGKCQEPEVTPTCTPTPEEVTPTPTQVTPTPECEGEDCQLTPTPTATPEATPTPTETPTTNVSSGSSTGTPDASQPSCTVAFNAPILQGFQALGNGSVNFSWWGVDGADKYSIVYGYAPDNLQFGLNDIHDTNITLNGLQSGSSVWARIYAWKGQCAEISNELDPLVR